MQGYKVKENTAIVPHSAALGVKNPLQRVNGHADGQHMLNKI
jgi:hypothetical protein